LGINLLVGKLLRPKNPEKEKEEIYECGEPTIGSSFVQFDLRFYVVALLFIIFDVEVAFFFPWATAFGKATQLADPSVQVVANGELTPAAHGLLRELGVAEPALPATVPASLQASVQERVRQGMPQSEAVIREGSRQLALFSIIDIAVFFGVLMVGFAYVWKRGDLDWVRAVSGERAARPSLEEPAPPEPALSA
jgi:NADH-quinone oxidoreductase subunit A